MNIWTIAEDIRARLNELDSPGYDAEKHESGNRTQGVLDERETLQKLEKIIDKDGW